jgi:hypothetical protein
MNKFTVVLTYAFLAIAAGVPADAADALPVWAYPVNPPGLKPASDDGSLKHVPNSAAAFTLTQIRDLFSPPDWHPDNHADEVGRRGIERRRYGGDRRLYRVARSLK